MFRPGNANQGRDILEMGLGALRRYIEQGELEKNRVTLCARTLIETAEHLIEEKKIGKLKKAGFFYGVLASLEQDTTLATKYFKIAGQCYVYTRAFEALTACVGSFVDEHDTEAFGVAQDSQISNPYFSAVICNILANKASEKRGQFFVHMDDAYYRWAIYYYARCWSLNEVIVCLGKIKQLDLKAKAESTDVLYHLLVEAIDEQTRLGRPLTYVKCETLLAHILKKVVHLFSALETDKEAFIQIIPPTFWMETVGGMWCPIMLAFIMQMSQSLNDNTYLNFFQAILPSLKAQNIWGKYFVWVSEKERNGWTAVELLVHTLSVSWDTMEPFYRQQWIQCLQQIAEEDNEAMIWYQTSDKNPANMPLVRLNALYEDHDKKEELRPLMQTIEKKSTPLFADALRLQPVRNYI